MLTGLELYYFKVCKRKLWLYTRQLRFEQENSDVKIGKVIDSQSYSREEKGLLINNEINIDYFPKDNIIHEIKKSKKIEAASILQVKYYLYYLEQLGVNIDYGKIDYPLLRRSVIVHLEEEDRKELEEIIAEIIELKSLKDPPPLTKKQICKNCAYHDYCFI